MNTIQLTAAKVRQRKFLLVLPLLVLPFITLIFWSLGGGKGGSAQAASGSATGFNMNLPDAYLKKEGAATDKMSYYDQAAADSARLKDLLKNDPNYRPQLAISDTVLGGLNDTSNALSNSSFSMGRLSGRLYSTSGYNDPNEAKVYQKLAGLNAALSAGNPSGADPRHQDDGARREPIVNSSDVDRLEKLLQSASQKSEDPEMGQLDGMLEKILDIQHPDRAQEKLQKRSAARRGQVFAVAGLPPPVITSSLDQPQGSLRQFIGQNRGSGTNGFYSFDDPVSVVDSQNAVEAVVQETQTVVTGSVLKFRLVSDVFINGIMIPRGQFIFGIAELAGERLKVKITGVRYHQSLFPVALSVFDLDGLEGIYIPGAIARDVAKESTERGLQGAGFTSLDPSLGVQAAGVGLQAAKTFLSRKTKLIRVTVKAGYQVLLRDEQQKQ